MSINGLEAVVREGVEARSEELTAWGVGGFKRERGMGVGWEGEGYEGVYGEDGGVVNGG